MSKSSTQIKHRELDQFTMKHFLKYQERSPNAELEHAFEVPIYSIACTRGLVFWAKEVTVTGSFRIIVRGKIRNSRIDCKLDS